MKVGERGQVTIPKPIRDRFGLGAEAEVDFVIVENEIVLRKKARPLQLDRWKGRCADALAELGFADGDELLEELRGR